MTREGLVFASPLARARAERGVPPPLDSPGRPPPAHDLRKEDSPRSEPAPGGAPIGDSDGSGVKNLTFKEATTDGTDTRFTRAGAAGSASVIALSSCLLLVGLILDPERAGVHGEVFQLEGDVDDSTTRTTVAALKPSIGRRCSMRTGRRRRCLRTSPHRGSSQTSTYVGDTFLTNDPSTFSTGSKERCQSPWVGGATSITTSTARST